MQHLALIIRFLILEEEREGPIPDIRRTDIEEYVNRYKRDDGIDNFGMENKPHAKKVIRYMNAFYDVFKDDPTVDENNGMKELKTEYFIISFYLLLRHLIDYYVFQEKEKELFKNFVISFYSRWSNRTESDSDALLFSDNNQQSGSEIATRERIIRQLFFEYVQENDYSLIAKDDKRSFNEAERIQIYRRDEGLCQICLEEGLSRRDALVPWNQFEADHLVPHSKGGRTVLENAQLLCRNHNKRKGNF
jgi:hypothetical protein